MVLAIKENWKILLLASDSTKEVKKNLASIETNHTTSEGDQKVGKSPTITAALASAGHVLDGADLELVLKPLRLAFETKNIKVVELALDCLHVCPFCIYPCI